MAEPGGKNEKSDREKRTVRRIAQRQMKIDAQPNEMIGDTIDQPAYSGCLVGESRKLAIGIVESIRGNVQKHAENIQA